MVEQYLLWLNERGFKPNDLESRGFNGNTPLLQSALEANAMMVTRLIEAGADLYAINSDYNGVLFNACYANSPEIIRLLIDAGADIDDQNEEGTTALMYAASASRIDCVRTLMQLGANPKLLNDDGLSAIELTPHREIFKELRSA